MESSLGNSRHEFLFRIGLVLWNSFRYGRLLVHGDDTRLITANTAKLTGAVA
jgi:hypothetical protein